MESLLDESPPINEIVGLLNRVAPTQLSRLGAEFPEFSPLLKVGKVLGSPKSGVDAARLRFLIAVADAGIQEAYPVADRCSVLAHARLVSALRLEVGAQVLSLLTGAATIFLIYYFGKDAKTLFAAVTSFAANALLAVVRYKRTGVSGGKDTLASVHTKLVAALPELEFLRGRLKSHCAAGSPSAGSAREIGQLVARAEQLCKEIRVQAAEIPGCLCHTPS